MNNYDSDLDELDRIWPLGKKLIVPDGGTVLVAGAYEGRYIDYIVTRFRPGHVIGYEPQEEKLMAAQRRLTKHGCMKTTLEPRGIGVHDCRVSMDNYGTDGCKVSVRDDFTWGVDLVGIDRVLDGYGPFDLFICNMEGYEIPLLAYLCATGRISEIKSLAVQFHTESNVPFLLTKIYGVPLYDDLPTWGYWR